jgi:hypothetical protein
VTPLFELPRIGLRGVRRAINSSGPASWDFVPHLTRETPQGRTEGGLVASFSLGRSEERGTVRQTAARCYAQTFPDHAERERGRCGISFRCPCSFYFPYLGNATGPLVYLQEQVAIGMGGIAPPSLRPKRSVILLYYIPFSIFKVRVAELTNHPFSIAFSVGRVKRLTALFHNIFF